KPTIRLLPPELLSIIFSFLSDKTSLAKYLTVCKQWADILIALIWFRPKLKSPESLQKIGHIMDLNQSSTFWNYKPLIRRLNLCFISKFAVDDLLLKFIDCPNLERLTLVNCIYLTPFSISSVLVNCSKLQSIDMTGVPHISDSIFDALATNCPKLQGLYAPETAEVSKDSIINLFKKCILLKRIKLTESNNINDETVDVLTENCKFLVEIDFHGCLKITNNSLMHVFQKMTQLREIRLSKNSNISDNMLKLLQDKPCLDRLRIIDFTACTYITDRVIEKFVKCAPRLRNVILSKCISITDKSLKSLSNLRKSLHYLHLGHCSNITDYGITTLIKNCHRLQYIDLACCSQLTDVTVKELATLRRLRRIGLVKCYQITNEGILELVRIRGNDDTLERVHLSYCQNLTIPPIFQLLISCPKLAHLSLTGIVAFLRNDIRKFCREAPSSFTEQQKKLFCVFSGNGVRQLRDFLKNLPNSMT
ncbi:SCF ubiquitin ligase complex subunit GRR1, partial [Ascoidea rubescens DSM 1968]